MKPEEQRMAIAEWCGWRWDLNDSKEVYWIHKEKPFLSFKSPPDYPNDLNAMHESEKNLKDKDIKNYVANIWMAMHLSPEAAIGTIHATAAQRAEALLKTIGKWKD